VRQRATSSSTRRGSPDLRAHPASRMRPRGSCPLTRCSVSCRTVTCDLLLGGLAASVPTKTFGWVAFRAMQSAIWRIACSPVAGKPTAGGDSPRGGQIHGDSPHSCRPGSICLAAARCVALAMARGARRRRLRRAAATETWAVAGVNGKEQAGGGGRAGRWGGLRVTGMPIRSSRGRGSRVSVATPVVPTSRETWVGSCSVAWVPEYQTRRR
jgi:hypothetical protein